MIRINLLPQARRQARGSSKSSSGGAIWAVAYLGFTLILGAGLAVVYVVYDDHLDGQLSQNQQLQTRINTLRQRSARLEEVQAQLEGSRALEGLVDDLNRARTGPTRVLMELSQILTTAPSGGPTIDPAALEQMRRENPLAGYNQSWDVKRLWLTGFSEEARTCRILGQGKTNEDVAEFMRRLSLSELFEAVTLTKTEQVHDQGTELNFIGFELNAQVRY